jgi:hypothetical protein
MQIFQVGGVVGANMSMYEWCVDANISSRGGGSHISRYRKG